MKIWVSLAAAAAALLTSPWLTAAETKGGTDRSDPAAFVQAAAQAGMVEVETGKMAQAQSRNAEVKAFGSRMVTDHGKANEELKTIAKSKPTSTTSTRSTFRKIIRRARGRTPSTLRTASRFARRLQPCRFTRCSVAACRCG